MAGLADLDAAARQRLTTAFEQARKLWGPRARFARHAGVDQSTVQVLEGSRPGPMTDDMIERLTIAVGWEPGHWRSVAAATSAAPRRRTDQEVEDLIADAERIREELSLKLGELERATAELRQLTAGEESQAGDEDDPA